jgi:hypothetical protein
MKIRWVQSLLGSRLKDFQQVNLKVSPLRELQSGKEARMVRFGPYDHIKSLALTTARRLLKVTRVAERGVGWQVPGCSRG